MRLNVKNNSKYIALSAICKENIKDIIEWIEYHTAIGIDYFILYNNDSTQDIKTNLPKNLQNICDVIDWFYDSNGRQVASQKHCINNYRHFKWIGFLDIDEYIVLLNTESNIKSYMKEYEKFDGLCLHWLFFGSNGHTTKQNSTIYAYTQSCPSYGANEHIKSIINPKKYNSLKHFDPHYIPTDNSVNVLKERVVDAFGSTRQNKKAPIINQIMRINHYYTKSVEDFMIKRARGGGNKVKRIYNNHHFESVQKENVFNDDIIQLYNKIKSES